MSNNKKKWLGYAHYLNLAFSIGISMVLTILLGVYGGLWLDRRLDTSPLFLLVGVFLGVGGGFYNLWSELSKLNELNKERKLVEKGQHEGIIKNSHNEEGKKEK